MTHKKMFHLLTLSLFVVMVAISPLQAAEGCKKMKAEGCEMMKAKGCMMMCSQLPNLTAEQKVKLEKLHLDCQKMMPAAKAEMEKQALEMKALMKDPVDVKKVEAKIDELAKMHADMQKKCLAQRLAVRALLTDEQKTKFDEMGCGMMHGMGCLMGGCRMEAKEGKCCMKGHGLKMGKGECPKVKEEVKK